LALFIISFAILGLTTGFVHLAAMLYKGLFITKPPVYRYIPPGSPVRVFESAPKPPRRLMRRKQEAGPPDMNSLPATPLAKVRRLSTFISFNRPTYGDSSG
jgi:hypothetical protein